jgi:hypothetical protein
MDELQLWPNQVGMLDWLLDRPSDVWLSVMVQHARLRQGITTTLFRAIHQSTWTTIYYIGHKRVFNIGHELIGDRLVYLGPSPDIKVLKKYADNSVVIIDKDHITVSGLVNFILPWVTESFPPIIACLSLGSRPHTEWFNVTKGGKLVQDQRWVVSRYEKVTNVHRLVDAGQGCIRARFIDNGPPLWNDDAPYVMV